MDALFLNVFFVELWRNKTCCCIFKWCLTIARTLLIYDFCLVRISTALTCNSRFNYADELNENIRNFLLVNLMNKVLVRLCQFLTLSLMYHTQYMLLTLANDLLCLELHTVGSQFFRGFFKPFISPTVI